MAMSILVDTGFWIALYDNRDGYHEEAVSIVDLLNPHNIVIPWPSLYEILNTRFARHRLWIEQFTALISKENTILLPDETYRGKALDNVLSRNSRHGKAYSLVDEVMRQMIADINIKVDAVITFNSKDFIDICLNRNILIFPE